MAKGTEAKAELFNKLMEIYPDSFWEDQNKILRIPMSEAGVRVEIKVSLTAAKTNLGGDAVPGAFGNEPVNKPTTPISAHPMPSEVSSSIEMTQEEKDNVMKMMKALNL